MKLISKHISPVIFGTWVLRVTNDNNIENGLNFIKINEEPIIKLKTIKQDGLFGIKKSRTAIIKNFNYLSKNTYNFTLDYSTKNTYSYSFLGIEIPEFKTKSMSYNKTINLSMLIHDKTIIINDKLLYYIFDLNIGNIQYPNVETNLNTFMFTQIISILLGILITNLFFKTT